MDIETRRILEHATAIMGALQILRACIVLMDEGEPGVAVCLRVAEHYKNQLDHWTEVRLKKGVKFNC